MESKYQFSPASREEEIVYGACRPGYFSVDSSSQEVSEWVRYMRHQGIERVCCLLAESELEAYDDLLPGYEAVFGADRVLHVPIADFRIIDAETFHNRIIPFLKTAEAHSEPVLVHCSAGMGRTGHVLVLWLAQERDYDLYEAVREVRQTGRKPLEAANRADLESILTA